MGPLRLAVAGLMIITVTRLHDYLGLVAVLRPGLLLLGSALLCIALSPRSARLENLTREWPTRAVLAFGGVVCLSALTGMSAGGSVTFVTEVFSRVMTFFGIMVVSIFTIKHLRFMMATYVLSLVILVYIVIFVIGVTQLDGYSRIGESAMYDGNDLGVVFLIGVPFAFLLVQTGRWKARLLGIVALIGIPACVLLTGSRGGFLGLLATAGALLFLVPRVSVARRVGVVALACVATVVFAPAGYWEKMATMLNWQDDYNVTDETGRIAIWKRGMGYVIDYPIFGVGPDNFLRAGWTIPSAGTGLAGTGVRPLAPHNTFLQVWAEIGTVGIIIWLILIVGGIRGCLRLRRRMPESWLDDNENRRFLYLTAGYLPASLISFSVTAFFTSHAYSAMFYILIAFFSAFLMLAREEMQDPGHSHRNQRPESARFRRAPMKPISSTAPTGAAIPLPSAAPRIQPTSSDRGRWSGRG
jgi:putative inorganic carbon (hco3(-)) transporter